MERSWETEATVTASKKCEWKCIGKGKKGNGPSYKDHNKDPIPCNDCGVDISKRSSGGGCGSKPETGCGPGQVENYDMDTGKTTCVDANSITYYMVLQASALRSDLNLWDLKGPCLVLAGQPIWPKPGGVGGGGTAGKWTSPASKALRGADRVIQKTLGTNRKFAAKGIVHRYLGTRGIGAAAGRAVPYVGLILTAWDVGWYLGQNYGPSTWFESNQDESILYNYMCEKGMFEEP